MLAPGGKPLATEGVAGERAEDPLSVPCSARGQQSVGRRGLVCVGDGTRAAQATRACSALSGDSSLCPRPHGPLAEGAVAGALERVWRGDQALISVLRAPEPGEPKRMAPG